MSFPAVSRRPALAMLLFLLFCSVGSEEIAGVALPPPVYVVALYEGDELSMKPHTCNHLARRLEKEIWEGLGDRNRAVKWDAPYDEINNCKDLFICEVVGVYEEKVGDLPTYDLKYELRIKSPLEAQHATSLDFTCTVVPEEVNLQDCREWQREFVVETLQAHDVDHRRN